ncbi:MAG: riboflavin biosynthesis protein RibF [Clostridiaceae bacterium]|jgi:riboflavin kinase/FMN adenylyltransferase|nr:riboflavin biosynthesis protein RibF [Clostridiaceae bacterium]
MLTVYQSLDEIKTVPRGFALGVFDGVHLGHLSLIRALRDSCSERNLRPCVFTFSYGDGYDFNDRRLDHNFLMTQAQKLDVFQREGVSEVFLIPLTHDFCDLSPFEFLDSVIAGKLGGRVLAIGEDGHFGRGGKGGADFLEDYAANHSLEPLVVPEVLLNGEKISSTRIREALKKGEVEDATRMMSRPFRLTGEVISGNRLGRRIGFPTANILYPAASALVRRGVYATYVIAGESRYKAITNVGTAPTVRRDSRELLAESYVFDFDGDLYGQIIEVEFLSFIRDERRFKSLDELKTQVDEDLASVLAQHSV